MTTKTAQANRKYFAGIGRRKTAVAQVRLWEQGKGMVTIGERALADVLPDAELQHLVLAPLEENNLTKQFDVTVVVRGGGKRGQAEAIRLGIARAIEKHTPELRKPLKASGYLKRDARIKERKKPGRKRARRSPQWSKR